MATLVWPRSAIHSEVGRKSLIVIAVKGNGGKEFMDDIKRIKSSDQKWYRKIWSLDIKNMSWTEETTSQVDFIWKTLDLRGGEKILDLACGFGRHALELARRGCKVIGVDITKEYVDDANTSAIREGLEAQFILRDIRNIDYMEEFDVVLNLADGAIGYLENDTENRKIFEAAASALKPGGKHFIDICNAEYARKHFPKRHWEVGRNALALADFDWDEQRSVMYYGGSDIPYGEPLEKPTEIHSFPIRLYGHNELKEIYDGLGMRFVTYYGDYNTSQPGSDDIMQIQVVAEKM